MNNRLLVIFEYLPMLNKGTMHFIDEFYDFTIAQNKT